jgi:hypothetical protein
MSLQQALCNDRAPLFKEVYKTYVHGKALGDGKDIYTKISQVIE